MFLVEVSTGSRFRVSYPWQPLIDLRGWGVLQPLKYNDYYAACSIHYLNSYTFHKELNMHNYSSYACELIVHEMTLQIPCS